VGRISEQDALAQHHREFDAGGRAAIDMRLDFQLEGEDRVLLSVGGSWNLKLEDFDQDADGAVVVRIHAGQVRAVEWFALWMAKHSDRRRNPPTLPEDFDLEADLAREVPDDEVYSALFAGGRRGGKTWIAAALCLAYAIAFPDALVWVVEPSRGKDDDKADEVRRYFARLLAPAWVTHQTAGEWVLINGSKIQLKSAHTGSDPDAIKQGEAHLIWMNEGQKMKKRVYTVGRAAIVDRSGLVLICANPPVEAKDEQWVSDFASDAETKRRASVYIHFNPLDNHKIDRRGLLSMKAEVDERTFKIEVLGEFLGPADAVAYNWQRMHNEMPAPKPGEGMIDVTEAFMRLVEEGEGIRDVIGADMQVLPYIGGPVYRFFCPVDKQISRETVRAWIVGEVILEGDELDWCAELAARKFNPATTLIICDATAEYQHTRRRSTDTPPPEWQGRGSFDLIRQAGYTRIVPPSRRLRKKNPPIVDRIRAMTSMISSGTGVRRLFIDRDKAPKAAQAVREWRNVHGKPSRIQEVAHMGDGISYPMIRLFPRIQRSGKPAEMDPVTQRVDRQAVQAAADQPRRASRRDRYRGL